MWGRIYLEKKGKGKQNLLYDINTVGKNIKWRRGERDGNFVEKIKIYKEMGIGKNIKL